MSKKKWSSEMRDVRLEEKNAKRGNLFVDQRGCHSSEKHPGERNTLDKIGLPNSQFRILSSAFQLADMADDISDNEEAFEDAPDTVPEPPDLLSSVRAAHYSFNLFLNNRFQEAKDNVKPWIQSSIYHALGYSALHFCQALLTFDPHDVELAYRLVQEASELCNKKRRKSTISNNTVTKLVKRPNYNSYTEEEVHAELIYAELLLLRAMASFVHDESLINFIKGGFRIRSCFMSYKECYDILTHRKWDNAELKMNFEAGVFLGIGTFNLVISVLPGRILRLLEFIGFSGNMNIGMNKLEQGRQLQNSIRGPLCSLCILMFNLVFTYILGNGKINLAYCKSVLAPLLEAFPKGTVVQYLKARTEEIQGNISLTIENLTHTIDTHTEWPQLKFLCYWELAWCHAFVGNYRQTMYYINLLKSQSHWSKSIPLYMHASITLLCNDLSDEEHEQIVEFMRMTPSLRRRFAGKSVPMEKFFCKRALRFIAQDNWLFLPAVECLYTWNYFLVVGKNLECTTRMLCLVERALEDLSKTKLGSYYYTDNYCLGVFLRGVCLRYMQSPLLAEESFKEVIQNEKKILEDDHLLPWSYLELGYMHIELKNYAQAKEFLETAKNNYKGYCLESRLHFKVHAGLAEIKHHMQAPTNLNDSGLSHPSSLEILTSAPASLPLSVTPEKNSSGLSRSTSYSNVPSNGPASLPLFTNNGKSAGMERDSIYL